jgi:hypothetical protein
MNSNHLTTMDKVVRDHLYDATKPGAPYEDIGITVQQILDNINVIRGSTTDAGAIRRSLNNIETFGLLTKRTLPGKRTQAFNWKKGEMIPTDYKNRPVQWTHVPSPQTAVSPSRKINEDLDAAIADKLKQVTGTRGPVRIAPKPKIHIAPVTRPNNELYYPRELAGKPDVDALRKLREESLFALLSGPPGGGKTAMLEAAFAGQTGGLFIITGDAGTRTDDFIGQWNPTGKQDEFYWSDGPLILAMRAGGVLFIDDATLIDTKEIACTYPAMDGRKEIRVKSHPVQKDGRMQPDVVTAQPGFFVVAAHNPGVAGAILSDALASRFKVHIWVETDLDLAGQLGVNATFIKLARNLRTRRNNGDLSVFVPEMRDLLAARDIGHAFGDRAACENLVGKASEDFQKDFAGEIKSVFGFDVNVKRLEVKGQL